MFASYFTRIPYLLLLCFFEVMLITFWNDIAGPYINPAILLVSSLGIAACYYFSRPVDDGIAMPNGKSYRLLIQILIFISISVVMAYKVNNINKAFPVSEHDASYSDVIPTVILFVKRAINGEFPYTPMYFPQHTVFPTYLPFMWLPYLFAEILNIDYRWIPFAAFWTISLCFFVKAVSNKRNVRSLLEGLVVPVFPLLVWCFIVKEDDSIIKATVESLVAAYYLLFAMSMRNRNLTVMVIALSLCLLSRYSVVVWLPFCLVVLFVKERKEFIRVLLILTAFFIIFYGYPFLRHNPDIFRLGYEYYTKAAIGEWSVAKHQNGYWHLGNGLGFSKWATAAWPNLSVEELVDRYKKIHLGAIVGVVLLLTIYFVANYKKIETRRFLLFSVKVYLTIFYAFVQVPYKYLFLVPIITSSALLLDRYRSFPKSNRIESIPITSGETL